MDDTCSVNKFETQLNFCDDWCNTESIWPGCGVHTLPGDDPRNTDNVDYHCSCDGCNGCSNIKILVCVRNISKFSPRSLIIAYNMSCSNNWIF